MGIKCKVFKNLHISPAIFLAELLPKINFLAASFGAIRWVSAS